MYNLIVIGQGLSGLLAAIWAKEHNQNVALVSSGVGKLMQATGVMEVMPAIKDYISVFNGNRDNAIEAFKVLTDRLEYPYQGSLHELVPIVTGSGRVKHTNLYPNTIAPIIDKGHVVVVGFQEIIDFQPKYIKENLLKDLPGLVVDTISVSLGHQSQRTMTQLDAARLLDKPDVRQHVLNQIKEKTDDTTDMYIFPACLGVDMWSTVLADMRKQLHATITEAPGMPPNATAVRLFNVLKKEAVRLGIRFYKNSQVVGHIMENDTLQKITINNVNSQISLKAEKFIIATGGILGGGLEKTVSGIQDTVLGLPINELGQFKQCPDNVYPVGASCGIQVTQYGITGGVFSILSSYESVVSIERARKGELQNA
ncbi:FAD-binding protein [Bacillus salinus]|uniref:FAD-binding protein n=1 Tax=Bacillus sp. HMF5848 TaxID=2495421 RepID=UPI00163B2F7E|nr:FAD-binding protein [Bacillus sp. HMF5848]